MNINIYILIEIKFCVLDILGDRICNFGNLYYLYILRINDIVLKYLY